MKLPESDVNTGPPELYHVPFECCAGTSAPDHARISVNADARDTPRYGWEQSWRTGLGSGRRWSLEGHHHSDGLAPTGNDEAIMLWWPHEARKGVRESHALHFRLLRLEARRGCN